MSAMTEMTDPHGRAWIELDLANLRHNVAVLRALLPPGCELMPALKANAYGHGAVPIAKELRKLGVEAFCVASVQEGVELRQHGISGMILILGYTHPTQFSLLRRFDLTQTVVDYSYAKLLNEGGRQVRVHLGIDTGMHRLGENAEEIGHICEMFQMENLCVDGLYTHLCAGDTDSPRDRAFTLGQGAAFRRLIERLEERGLTCPKNHILSSYGLLNYPELGGAYARVGIALYGVFSAREDEGRYHADLRPVLSLKARVAAVKTLQPGEYAGYGLAFQAEKETKLAVLTIGYGDGLPRSLSCGVGSVLIGDRMAPIVGRICMDQTTVDVTEIPGVRAGAIATIIGVSGETQISACEIAEQTHTISNEILSRLGSRLERAPRTNDPVIPAKTRRSAPEKRPAGIR